MVRFKKTVHSLNPKIPFKKWDEAKGEMVIDKICMPCEQSWRVLYVREFGEIPAEAREVTACEASDRVNPSVLEDREIVYFNGEKGEWYTIFRDSHSEELPGGDRRVTIDGKTFYKLTKTEFFITMAGVNADRNAIAKTTIYRDIIQKTRAARSMIDLMENEKAAGELRLNRKQKNKVARDAAYDWAQELLHVISTGPFWKAFSRAGKLFENADKLDRLEELYDEYAKSPSAELQKEIDELEATAADTLTEYTAFDGDPRCLKAADYENFFGNGFYKFDLCCRRRNGYPCGIYACSFLWWRPTERWRYYCHMAYWLLDKEDHLYKQLAKYFGCERNDGICPKGMSQQFGFRQDQECNWDDLGCGCYFRPWKDGDSKVVEIVRRDASVTCFRAARLPPALDNAIKQDQETFYKALGLLTHEDILQAIPMVHPRTNPITETIVGISRFPIDQAEREGWPRLSEEGWMKLARAVYRKNQTALRYIEHIFVDAADVQGDV